MPKAVKTWNAMGGEINWTDLEILFYRFGITDPEIGMVELETIRNWFRR